MILKNTFLQFHEWRIFKTFCKALKNGGIYSALKKVKICIV